MGYQHTNSKGKTYYLNSKEVPLNGGRMSTIFYFSKDIRPEHCDLPEGYTVGESKSTLPVVKKAV